MKANDLRTRLQEKGAYDTLQSVKANEYRRVNDRVHKISRAIVEEAKGRDALIVVGFLEGIQNQDLAAEMNRRLHSMPHHTLKNYIEYNHNKPYQPLGVTARTTPDPSPTYATPSDTAGT